MDTYTKHQICTILDDINRVCDHLYNSADKFIGIEGRKEAMFLLEKFADKYKKILEYEEE